MSLKNSTHLFPFEANATSEIIIPKMTPNTAVYEFFDNLNDSSVGVTQVSLVTSFIVNVFLSGPMDLLWGLINSL